MKQRQLSGIENMADAHARLMREDKGRKLALYAAILEVEFNPNPDPVEFDRVSKLMKRLRRWL